MLDIRYKKLAEIQWTLSLWFNQKPWSDKLESLRVNINKTIISTITYPTREHGALYIGLAPKHNYPLLKELPERFLSALGSRSRQEGARATSYESQ